MPTWSRRMRLVSAAQKFFCAALVPSVPSMLREYDAAPVDRVTRERGFAVEPCSVALPCPLLLRRVHS